VRVFTSSVKPLYEIKANLFKGLAHPVRVRVLEILAASSQQSATVGQLLEETDLEASHLSQHLATLRRHGVVTSRREGSAVVYTLAHPGVAELLAIARIFLRDTLSTARERLAAADQLDDISTPATSPNVSSMSAGVTP